MQAVPSVHAQRRGGRLSSPQHRKTQDVCQDFTGLEEGVARYDLLLLVKRTGKEAGFTPAMIRLLDYYMAYTRDLDWEEGSRPVVYQSLTRTALDLGISERQVQKLEKQLFERGAMTWNDSGNHRRYGVRDEETGRLLYAYGVDLTPLAYLRGELQDKLHEKQLYEKAWLETKRQISWYRAQIRALLSEAWQQAEEGRGPIDTAVLARHQSEAETLARPLRTYMTLEALRALLHAHKELHGELVAALTPDEPQETTRPVSPKSSSRDEQTFVHKEATKQKPSNKLDTGNADLHVDVQVRQPQAWAQNSKGNAAARPAEAGRGAESGAAASQTPPAQKAPAAEPPSPPEGAGQGVRPTCGLEHLTWKQIMLAASDRFLDRLVCRTVGIQRQVLAGDCVRAAYDLTGSLGISHRVWAEACAVLGDQAAAVCIVLIDHAMHRADKPVRQPNGYFRAMIDRAARGELHLHKSICGILQAGRGGMQA